jgi:hypothetical protein
VGADPGTKVSGSCDFVPMISARMFCSIIA